MWVGQDPDRTRRHAHARVLTEGGSQGSGRFEILPVNPVLLQGNQPPPCFGQEGSKGLKVRFDDEIGESQADARLGVQITVHAGRDRQTRCFFCIALSKEFSDDQVRPLLRDRPGSNGVADVGRVQQDSRESSALIVGPVGGPGLFFELVGVLEQVIVKGHVGGQDEVLEEIGFSEQVVFSEEMDRHVDRLCFEYGLIVIITGQVTLCFRLKIIVKPWLETKNE